jgi:hypothetical protein
MLISIIIILAFLLMRLIITPYLKYSRMKSSLQGKYKFDAYPFKPYGFSFIQRIIQDFKQYGDSFYTRKHVFSKSDLTIGTIRDHLFLSLIDKKLVHDFA